MTCNRRPLRQTVHADPDDIIVHIDLIAEAISYLVYFEEWIDGHDNTSCVNELVTHSRTGTADSLTDNIVATINGLRRSTDERNHR